MDARAVRPDGGRLPAEDDCGAFASVLRRSEGPSGADAWTEDDRARARTGTGRTRAGPEDDRAHAYEGHAAAERPR